MIYFDNAATTKPDTECLKLAEKYLGKEFFNPSALYAEGYNLQLEIKKARNSVLSHIADPENYSLIFTSGGTESDNQSVFCGAKRGNAVFTSSEHSAVYSSALELKQRGVEVRFCALNKDGSADVADLLNLIDEKTSFVSVIHVNNETGAINDINNIAQKVKEKNRHLLFHSDGVQAYGKIPFKLSKEIDLYSISAHKIGGIKGCGALIKKKNILNLPFIFGGGQEQGLRSGTENVLGIKCFEVAADKKFKYLKNNYEAVKIVNRTFKEKINKDLFKIISSDGASPYILSLSAVGLRGETVLHEADDKGLIIGTGSACSSNSKKRYSRIILACGYDEIVADGVLRISFSAENDVSEAEKAAEILNYIAENRKKIME